MKGTLPNISSEIASLFPLRAIGASHAYGDLWVAAQYCGFSRSPAAINGEWQHGHIIPERNIHPEFVIASTGRSRDWKNSRYYVARQDQVDYLNTQQYTDVQAIGMPIIYVKRRRVERIKGSLLIMPMHTLPQTNETFNEEEYASFIDSILPQFTKVVCCVHKSCFEKGYWIETFRKRNIEVVLSADEGDVNTLSRLAYLFSRFEYLTTNDFGSHLAYASFFGAKPSIAGPQPAWKREDYANAQFYKNCPELLDVLEKWRNEGLLKSQYPFLFVSPHMATDQQGWGSFQLGYQHKLSPSQMREKFGWDFQTLHLKKYKSIIRNVLKIAYSNAARLTKYMLGYLGFGRLTR